MKTCFSDGSQKSSREKLVRHAVTLEWFTVLYNLIEGGVAVGAGLLAGSIALVGFGMDSFIEVISGAFLLWRLRISLRTCHPEHVREEQRAERTALRAVSITFFLLSIYVLIRSAWILYNRTVPSESAVGIVIACLSLAIMGWLGAAKRRIGKAIGSRALMADAMETIICIYLSIILLVGLGANALWGWWWADPLAALLMTPFIVKEGIEAWEESQK